MIKILDSQFGKLGKNIKSVHQKRRADLLKLNFIDWVAIKLNFIDWAAIKLNFIDWAAIKYYQRK